MMAVERGASRHTLDAYRRDLADYGRFLRARAGTETADAGAVRAYLSELSQRGMAGSSVARRLSAIRQFHRFVYLEGVGRTIRPRRSTVRAGSGRCRAARPGRDRGADRSRPAAAARARRAPRRHTRAALCQRAARIGARGAAAVRARRGPSLPRGQGQGRQGASRAGGRAAGGALQTWQCGRIPATGSRQPLPVPLARARATSPDSASRSCCASWRPRPGSTPSASRRTSCAMPSPACSPAAPICARCS